LSSTPIVYQHSTYGDSGRIIGDAEVIWAHLPGFVSNGLLPGAISALPVIRSHRYKSLAKVPAIGLIARKPQMAHLGRKQV
jgi:hypothetical protein